MEEFYLKTSVKTDATTLSNTFIDRYMIDANGEYVKLYIYLLRCLTIDAPISFNELALRLELTIKEVKMALKYWVDKKVLTLTRDENGFENIVFASLKDNIAINDKEAPTDTYDFGVADDNKSFAMAILNKSQIHESATASGDNIKDINSYIPSKRINILLEQDDIKRMLYVAQQYLGRTLSNTDIQSLIFMYDKLGFASELIEHLLAYCISNKKLNMRYIEKVALDWAAKGVTDIDSAKLVVNNYSREYMDILKSLGINGRMANNTEASYIKKWLKEWSFDVEIVKKACEKTMMSAAKPSFNYVDSILESWMQAHVQTLEDVDALDRAFKKSKRVRTVGAVYDYDDIGHKYDQIEINLLKK